jgi:hypothetical protein
MFIRRLILILVMALVAKLAQAEVTFRVEGRSRITSIPATAIYLEEGQEIIDEGKIDFHSGPSRIPRLAISTVGLITSAVIGAVAQRPVVGVVAAPFVSVALHYGFRQDWRSSVRVNPGDRLVFFSEGISDVGHVFSFGDETERALRRALTGRRQIVELPTGEVFPGVPKRLLIESRGGPAKVLVIFDVPHESIYRETTYAAPPSAIRQPVITRCLDVLAASGLLR